MRADRDRLVRALIEEYVLEGYCTPGTVDSFALAFRVPRSRMKHLLKSLAKSGLLRTYRAHGEEHFVLNAVEF